MRKQEMLATLSQHNECYLGDLIYHMEYKYYSCLVFQVSIMMRSKVEML